MSNVTAAEIEEQGMVAFFRAEIRDLDRALSARAVESHGWVVILADAMPCQIEVDRDGDGRNITLTPTSILSATRLTPKQAKAMATGLRRREFEAKAIPWRRFAERKRAHLSDILDALDLPRTTAEVAEAEGLRV